MSKQLSLAEAKRLSIIKWEIFSSKEDDFNDSLTDAVMEHPELCDLRHNCGFCERWKLSDQAQNCERCEFGKVAGICQSEDSCDKDLFYDWLVHQSQENALKILEAIKSIEVPESEFEPCGKAFNQPNNPEIK